MRSKFAVAAAVVFLISTGHYVSPAAGDQLPDDFASFFAEVSVNLLAKRLKAGESFGHPARDDQDYNHHLNWARQNDMFTVMNDLIEKFRIMVDIKNNSNRSDLADWYAFVCVQWARYGVDFGSREANSTDRDIHFNWANDPSTSPEAVKAELERRIKAIYAVFSKKALYEAVGRSSRQIFPGEQDRGSKNTAGRIADALKGAKESMADTLGDLMGKVPVGDISSRLSTDTPPPGVAKIKDTLADPLYSFGEITSGAKLFIIGWNFGTRPGRAYLLLSKPVNGILQIDLEPFDFRGWKACWFDDVILARMPDIGRTDSVVHGYIILELPNGQRVRDLVYFGKVE